MISIIYQAATAINAVSGAIEAHFPSLLEYRYLILLIATSLEGFNTMILAGFLISIGTLSLIPAFFVCLAGEIFNSFMWYGVGYWAGAKPIDWFVRNSPRKKRFVQRIRSYLEKYTGRIVLLMKLTYSVTIPVMIMTGSLKYNLKKFTLYNVIGSIGWVIMMFSIGAFFGEGFKHYARYFVDLSYLVVFIIAVLVFIGLVEHFGKVLMERAMSTMEKIREAGEKISEGLDKIIGNGR